MDKQVIDKFMEDVEQEKKRVENCGWVVHKDSLIMRAVKIIEAMGFAESEKADVSSKVEQPAECQHENWRLPGLAPVGKGVCLDCQKHIDLYVLFENMRKRLQAMIDRGE